MKYKIIEHLNIDSKYYTIKLKKFLFWRTVETIHYHDDGSVSYPRKFDNLEDAQNYINMIIPSPKWIPIKTVIEEGKI